MTVSKCLALILVVFWFGTTTLSASAKGTQTKKNEKILSDGKSIYEKNCLMCHGENGDGQGPASKALPKDKKPRNFVKGDFKYGGSEKELFKTVTNGVKGTAMPPWAHMSKEDRQTVIKYILQFSRKN